MHAASAYYERGCEAEAEIIVLRALSAMVPVCRMLLHVSWDVKSNGA